MVTVTGGTLGVVTVVGVVTFTLGVVTVVLGACSAGTLGVVTVTLGRLTAGKAGMVTVTDGRRVMGALAEVAALATPDRPVLRPPITPSPRATRIDAARTVWRRRGARRGGLGLVGGRSGVAPTLVETDGGSRGGGAELDLVHHVGHGGEATTALGELVRRAGR